MNFVRLRRYAVRALLFVAVVSVAKDRPDPIRDALMQAQTYIQAKNLMQASDSLRKASVEILAQSLMISTKSSEAQNLYLAFQSSIWLTLQGQARVLEWRHRHSPNQAVIRAAGSPLPDELERRDRLFVSPGVGQALIGEIPYNLRTSNAAEAQKLNPALSETFAKQKTSSDETLIEIRPTMQDQSIQEYMALFQMGMEKAEWVFPRLLQWSAINNQSTNRWALSRLGQAAELNTTRGCAANLYSFSHHQVYKELVVLDRYEEWALDAIQKPIRAGLAGFFPFTAAELSQAFQAAVRDEPENRIFLHNLKTQQQKEFNAFVGMALDAQIRELATTDPDPYSLEIYGAVLPGDAIRPSETADLILKRVARRQVELAFPMVSALAGAGQKNFDGVGIPEARLPNVKARFLANLEKLTKGKNLSSTDHANKVRLALALLDSKAYVEKRKKERFAQKVEETVSSVQKFEKELAAWQLMRADSDGDISWKNSLVVDSVRNLVEIRNPAELREVWSAVLVDPDQDPISDMITQDKKVVEAFTEFYQSVAEKWSELSQAQATPQRLERIASETAQALISEADAEVKKTEDEFEAKKQPFQTQYVAVQDATYRPKPVFLNHAQKLKAVFRRMNLPVPAQTSKYRIPRMIETRGQAWTVVQTRMGRLMAESPILNNQVISKLAQFAVVRATGKLNLSRVREFVLARFHEASTGDLGKLEDFCNTNLRETGSDAFRKLYQSTAGTRQVLMQTIPGFKEWDQRMQQATKTALERNVDRLTTGFLIVGAIAATLALVVFTAGAASVAVPGIIATALALTTQVALPVMTVANLYATVTLNVVEKPIQIAYQEGVAKSRIYGDMPQAQGYLAQKSLDAADPVARAMVGRLIDRSHVRAARTKLGIDQGLTLVFALLDLTWMGAQVKGAIGKTVRASIERMGAMAVKMETQRAVKTVAKHSSKSVEALQGLQRLQQEVKAAFNSKITAKETGQVLKGIMDDMMSGKALKWFRPLVDSGELTVRFALRAGEAIGDDLVKFGAGLEDFIKMQRARLDTNGRLLGGLNSAEISKNPDATWFGIAIRTMTGSLDKPLQSGLHWTGLTSLSELRALRSGKAVTWFDRFGAARNDLLRLRGRAVTDNVIAPAESLLTKVKALENVGVDEYVAIMKKQASAAEAQVLDQVKTKGQVLMASLSHEERDVLRRMVAGESFLARTLGIYKIQRSLGLREIGKLGPILKDYEMIQPYARQLSNAAAEAYEPANYIREVEEGLAHGRAGAEPMDVAATYRDLQSQLEVIQQFDIGDIRLSPEAETILNRLSQELGGAH
ncbi:MAG: hypothetical protein JNL01_16125 [Bdellovibrionales bacterium]|nr:hypothetical protein [Bdellovibrionales bacterium]